MLQWSNQKSVRPEQCRRVFPNGFLQKGFTFAEVLLALFVLSTSMYLLSNLQFRSLIKVSDSREEIDRVFLIKKALYELFLDSQLKKDKPLVEKHEAPEVVITSYKQAIDKKKSALKDFSDDISISWSEGKWKSGLRDRAAEIISFVFKEKSVPKTVEEKEEKNEK